jgi:integrase
MKAAKEHKVPLCDRAIELLRALDREGDDDGYVFIGTRPGMGLSNMAMTTVLRRMRRADITVHGMRSTFRDWAAEQTNFPREVAEMALAHAIGDKVEAAYRRGELMKKRRALAQAWGKYCSSPPIEQRKSASVVPLHGAAR